MERYKRLAVFVGILLSLLFIHGVYGYFTDLTEPAVNQFRVKETTSYRVIHQLRDVDGVHYTVAFDETYEVPIGTPVSPEVTPYTGFTSPERQTVILNSFDLTTITYSYERVLVSLTITDPQFVTTATSTGYYAYGTEIHLIADATNNLGNPFVQWTNGVTSSDYTFTLLEDTTIGPDYAASYYVSFVPDNGDTIAPIRVIENTAVGSLPVATKDDCTCTTGDYHARGCTEVYKFEGWYLEPTFNTQVNESFVPTQDTTLYAKWNKIYFAEDGPVNFEGTNFIDTGVQMFNTLNAEKNFIVTFTVVSNNGYTSGDRGTIFTDMNEVAEPFPGVHFFTLGNTKYTMNVNILGNKVKDATTGYITGQSVVIKKVNGYIYYSYDGGPFVLINNFTDFDAYFDNHATFGAGTNASGNPYRYFKGTLSNMSVELIDPDSYTLHFDPNGGSGMMIDQNVLVGKTVEISANTFTYEDYKFSEWNTEPDGSGTSYTNHESIYNIASVGDVVTLYAQWIPATHYYVHFDANGGSGDMANQRFTYEGAPASLNANEFTKTDYMFMGWNTAADGSGTPYDDQAMIQDLSNIPDDVVTLYAQWMRIAYQHVGDAVFDGTSATFINTGVTFYSDQTEMEKDFIIRFTFKSVDSDVFTYTPKQPTLINCKNEASSAYPGFNIRINSETSTAVISPTSRWGGNTQNNPKNGVQTANAPIEFVYKRTGGVITLQYSYAGFESDVLTLYDQSSWTLDAYFNDPVAFGGYFDDQHNPGRFFKGTLSDMLILVDD